MPLAAGTTGTVALTHDGEEVGTIPALKIGLEVTDDQ